MKVRWFLAVALVALLVLVAWAFARLDWRAVARNLGSASLADVAAMAGVWLAALFVRPVRLATLLQAMSPGIGRRYWAVWASDMIAVAMNSVIPLRAGDMTMALVLHQSTGLSTPRGLSLVFVDRFFDLLTVVVLFYASISVAPSVAPWANGLMTTLPVGLAVLFALIWAAVGMRAFWLALVDRGLANLSPSRRHRWSARAHELFDGLAAVNRPKVLLLAVLQSVVLWGLTSTTYWLGLKAILPHAPFAAGMFAASAVALSFIVPSTPGGVGVFHAVAVLAFSLFNVPAEAALAAAIICHALMLGLILLLAGIAIVFHGVNVRSLSRGRTEPS